MRQSRDYDKVGTKSNARGWKQLNKYKAELQEARERNPLLAEQYDALNTDIIHHRQIAADAWGHHYPVDERAPQEMRDLLPTVRRTAPGEAEDHHRYVVLQAQAG